MLQLTRLINTGQFNINKSPRRVDAKIFIHLKKRNGSWVCLFIFDCFTVKKYKTMLYKKNLKHIPEEFFFCRAKTQCCHNLNLKLNQCCWQ